MTRCFRETTTTTLVTEALRSCDDFMNVEMLIAATRRARNQVSAALHELRSYRVVDVAVNPDGTGWWFALPPELDTRVYVVIERKPEPKGNRRRHHKPSIDKSLIGG